MSSQDFPFQITHGMSGTSTHRSWKAMKTRCLNPNSEDAVYYSSRGITVCERWMEFENFLEDMGVRPEGTSLDRIDSDKGYFPENCRWSDAKTQSGNRRHTNWIERDGKRLLPKDWCLEIGLSYATYKLRRKLKWSVEDALFKPVRGNE